MGGRRKEHQLLTASSEEIVTAAGQGDFQDSVSSAQVTLGHGHERLCLSLRLDPTAASRGCVAGGRRGWACFRPLHPAGV